MCGRRASCPLDENEEEEVKKDEQLNLICISPKVEGRIWIIDIGTGIGQD